MQWNSISGLGKYPTNTEGSMEGSLRNHDGDAEDNAD